jgi:hypothetical protein
MTSHDLHPLARDVLETFASQSYFRSIRLTKALADRSPTQCLRWAFNLVEHFVSASTPHKVATDTLGAIAQAIASPSAEQLPQLDELSWKSWCSDSFDEQSPFAQRAVARLGWASMILIGAATGTLIKSKYLSGGTSFDANQLIGHIADQCGMAVDMIYADTNDGRLMVAASFSREMAVSGA